MAILRIFALDGIQSSPSSSPIVVGIPASRSRSVEFELDRDLLSYYRTYETGVLSIPFRQVTPPPCHENHHFLTGVISISPKVLQCPKVFSMES